MAVLSLPSQASSIRSGHLFAKSGAGSKLDFAQRRCFKPEAAKGLDLGGKASHRRNSETIDSDGPNFNKHLDSHVATPIGYVLIYRVRFVFQGFVNPTEAADVGQPLHA